MEGGGIEHRLGLGHTNVSKPQLSQAPSRQSVYAAEDYESARTSTPPSDTSDDNPTHDSNRYSTPPQSPRQSPTLGHRQGQSQDSAISNAPLISRAAVPATASTTSSQTTVRRIDRQTQSHRKPIGSGERRSQPRLSEISDPASTSSQDVDDSPYIRFALDQLTRDEEVRGSRAYAYPSVGSGYRPSYRPLSDSTSGSPLEKSRDIPLLAAPMREKSPVLPQSPMPAALPQMPEPRESIDQINRESQPQLYISPPRSDILVPYDHGVPALRFLPSILSPVWLSVYLLLCLLMLAALLFSGIWSGTHDGLYDYTRFGDARYFVFQYLPIICGVVMLLWLFQIQIAVQRIAPFIAMASMSTKSRSQAPLMEYQTTGFLLPQLHYFRAYQPIVGICMIIFWLQIITVPLLSCLYNVYYYGPHNTGMWRWTTDQGVNWTLFALYLLLILAIATLGVWINIQRTGLRWDPRSMADIIAILERSSVVNDYTNSETFAKPNEFALRLLNRSDRLGYWQASSQPNETFYGIGEEGAATRRYSLEHGKIREKERIERSSFTPDTPSTQDDRHATDLESGQNFDRIRNRYLPFFLRPAWILLWCIAAIVLYLAFLIVSFIESAVIHGFSTLTPVVQDAAGFSSTNFTYSFVPALIAQFLFLAWLSIDYSFRRLQPYAAMSASNGQGASASDSLLLDYTAQLPFQTTVSALFMRDARIAWFSFLSLISATLPVLAGGCFWAQFYTRDQQVRVAVNPPAYYALCVFLALYAFSLPLLFIGLRRRRLPHAVTTLAETISFIYHSHVLDGPNPRTPVASRAQLTQRLVAPRTLVERTLRNTGEARFAFARFVGHDGRTHLGVERVGREEGPVLTAMPPSRRGEARARAAEQQMQQMQQTEWPLPDQTFEMPATTAVRHYSTPYRY